PHRTQDLRAWRNSPWQGLARQFRPDRRAPAMTPTTVSVPARPTTYVTERSAEMHERAKKSLAGGVASVARLFPSSYPPYLVEGQGAHVTDVDGNGYIDYNLAHGPLILG